jgi:hypothetical protein
MEVKVTNDKSEDFGMIFKVRRMNFDNIIVNYRNSNNGMKMFSFLEVNCISENEIDEFLIKNRDFLKIKLKRGISVFFYKLLYESLKLEVKEQIVSLNVLKDKYKINKNKIWEKEILLLINNKFTLEVIASGQNFKKSGYNIAINKIESNVFLEICYTEIKNIKSKIRLEESILNSLERAVQQVLTNNDITKELLL